MALFIYNDWISKMIKKSPICFGYPPTVLNDLGTTSVTAMATLLQKYNNFDFLVKNKMECHRRLNPQLGNGFLAIASISSSA